MDKQDTIIIAATVIVLFCIVIFYVSRVADLTFSNQHTISKLERGDSKSQVPGHGHRHCPIMARILFPRHC